MSQNAVFDALTGDDSTPDATIVAADAAKWRISADKTSHFWTGKIAVGSNGTEMDVAFDTSSDWLALEGSECKTCTGDVFDAGLSTSAKKTGKKSHERRYDEIRVTGTEWTDKVCLVFDRCVTDFEFFLIESQTFMKEPIDGFLGLGRSEPFLTGTYQKFAKNRGPSFVR